MSTQNFCQKSLFCQKVAQKFMIDSYVVMMIGLEHIMTHLFSHQYHSQTRVLHFDLIKTKKFLFDTHKKVYALSKKKEREKFFAATFCSSTLMCKTKKKLQFFQRFFAEAKKLLFYAKNRTRIGRQVGWSQRAKKGQQKASLAVLRSKKNLLPFRPEVTSKKRGRKNRHFSGEKFSRHSRYSPPPPRRRHDDYDNDVIIVVDR